MSAALHLSKLAASLRALSKATSLAAVCPAAAAAAAAAADTSVPPSQSAPQPTGCVLAVDAAQQQCSASDDRETGVPTLGTTTAPDSGAEADSGPEIAAPAAAAAPEEAGPQGAGSDVHHRCAHLLAAVKQGAGGGSEGAAAAVAALRLLQTVPVTASLLKITGPTPAAPSCDWNSDESSCATLHRAKGCAHLASPGWQAAVEIVGADFE